jgi:hypothetical protein
MSSTTHRVVVGSVEWVEFHIEVEEDPTTFPVEIALVSSGTVPLEADWRSAIWPSGAEGGPAVWNIRLLVGDAGADTDYAAGVYDAFSRIDSGLEVPITPVGAVEFYGGEAPRIIDSDELGDFLRLEIEPDDAGADIACDIASEVVRAKLRQTVTLVEDDVLRIEGSFADRVRLPERPIVDVSSVTIDGAELPPSSYNVIGDELVLAADVETWASITIPEGGFGGRRSVLEIVYSHGYAVVPADIKGLALAIAGRTYQNPQGVSSEGILSYRVSYGDAETFPLLPHEEAVVSRYRRRQTTLTMR